MQTAPPLVGKGCALLAATLVTTTASLVALHTNTTHLDELWLCLYGALFFASGMLFMVWHMNKEHVEQNEPWPGVEVLIGALFAVNTFSLLMHVCNYVLTSGVVREEMQVLPFILITTLLPSLWILLNQHSNRAAVRHLSTHGYNVR